MPSIKLKKNTINAAIWLCEVMDYIVRCKEPMIVSFEYVLTMSSCSCFFLNAILLDPIESLEWGARVIK